MKKHTYMKLLLVVLSGAVSVIMSRVMIAHVHFIPASWVTYTIIGGGIAYIVVNRYDNMLKVRRIRAERELKILKDITYHRYQSNRNMSKEQEDEEAKKH